MPAPSSAVVPEHPRLLFVFYMVGGNATIFQNMRQQIGGRDDVHSDWLPIEEYPADRLVRFPPFSLNDTLANSTVTRLRIRNLEHEGGKYDAAYYFQNTIVTMLWRLRRRLPYVLAMDGTPLWYRRNRLWYEHPDFDPASPLSRLKIEATRRVYAQARYLLPLSNSVRESLVEDYHADPEKVIVVPPGIDLQKYRAPDRSRLSPGRRKKVLFIGADFIRKGGEEMLALARRREFSTVEFHLVTRDFTGKPGSNVVIHGDVAADSGKMLALLAAADLFVLPTKADSHSIASLEAMAMGIPVIVSRVGGTGDIVVPGETGYFAFADDVTRLSGQVRQLLFNDELRLQMGRKARARVEERFNLAKNVDLVVSLLKETARSGRKARKEASRPPEPAPLSFRTLLH